MMGRFSTAEGANQAIENFVEGVLEIERPGYEQLVKKVIEI